MYLILTEENPNLVLWKIYKFRDFPGDPVGKTMFPLQETWVWSLRAANKTQGSQINNFFFNLQIDMFFYGIDFSLHGRAWLCYLLLACFSMAFLWCRDIFAPQSKMRHHRASLSSDSACWLETSQIWSGVFYYPGSQRA